MNNSNISSYAFNCFLKARSGNKSKQKEIILILEKDTEIIRYQYLKKAKLNKLSLLDLKDLVLDALFFVFKEDSYKKIDPDTFLNYFRMIYILTIKTKLNKQRSYFKEVSFSDFNNYLDDTHFINKENRLDINSYFEDNEMKKDYVDRLFEGSDILNYVIHSNRFNLTKNEKTVFILYVYGNSIKEIANLLSINGSTVYTHFYNARKKIKVILEQIN